MQVIKLIQTIFLLYINVHCVMALRYYAQLFWHVEKLFERE